MGEIELKQDLTTQEILDLLFDYVPRIAGEKSREQLVLLIANLGREIVVADRCTLWLLDESTQELYTFMAHGLNAELRMPADHGLAGEAVSTGKTILIDDAYKDIRFNPEPDQKNNYRTKAMLVLPIRNTEGKIMGAFQAINKKTSEGVFTKDDLKHLQLTSTYSGKTIEAALYLKRVEETLKRVEETQRTAIFMIGQQAESRSRETGNHVRRVAEYCALIGKYCGVSEKDIELLRLASPMHDAGKVATPDAILKKPGRLTPEEFVIMQQHAQIGYDVLNSSNEFIFQTAATIAITHHEKWNGTGYPHNLNGEQIPLFGRITAVADVFDALANDRCYKKAWPMEKVAQLFREESGQHFDPMLSQILLDHLDEFKEINAQYKDAYIAEESH